ncbi:MAG TPA: polyprenyl diphosphate synthase [Longimicrobiales bacterium]
MTYELLERLKLDGRLPRHVAVIMDGNGRWARARGLPRYKGHTAGMASVREVIEGCVEAGVAYLTLFAFSTENWNRPEREVNALMRLLQAYVKREAAELKRQGVEVHVHGDLERLASGPRRGVEEIQRITRGGDKLHLNLLISYSGRAELARAARRLAERVRAGQLDPAQVDEAALSSELYTAGIPDPDLLIRTSGEMRISNFMLWQLAYTEMVITPVLWPDFTRRELFAAILEYQGRDRRFGRVSAG